MLELCQNLFVNYAIQDLMEGMFKLREAARDDNKASSNFFFGLWSSFALVLCLVVVCFCRLR